MTQKQTSTRAGTRRSTPAPKFSAKVESIGPDKAKKYLALMPRNRRKRKRHKDRLTNSMNSGGEKAWTWISGAAAFTVARTSR